MNQRLFAALARRIRLAAGRAMLTLINDASKLQSAQVKLLDGEAKDRVERFQNYGFTSVPLSGAEGVYLALGGDRDHGVLIAVDDRRYRKRGMQPGESAMYNHLGDYIHIKGDRSIEIVSALKVRVDAPSLECTGDIKDRCDSDGVTMEAMRNTYNGHVHGGVQTGVGNTGTPNPGMG